MSDLTSLLLLFYSWALLKCLTFGLWLFYFESLHRKPQWLSPLLDGAANGESWWSQMQKAGGEPLRLRVSIPSNRNPLLSLVLYILRDGRLWPWNGTERRISIWHAAVFFSCDVRGEESGEAVRRLQRMRVRIKARCPRRTHPKSWPWETGMLL